MPLVVGMATVGVTDGVARCRDLLPLPTGQLLASLVSSRSGGNLSGQGRMHRGYRRALQWMLGGVSAFNAFATPGQAFPACASPAQAQLAAVDRLWSAYRRLPAKGADHSSDLESWHMIQTSKGGYGSEDPSAGNRKPYRKGNIPLPGAPAGGISLSSLLPPALQHLFDTGEGLIRGAVDLES